MKIKTILLLAVGGFFLTPVISFAQQNFEIGGYVGGQINGGVDLSTTLFHRIEVQNGTNYGITAGYLLGEHAGVEFNGTTTMPTPQPNR
jgi:hypothetical protein